MPYRSRVFHPSGLYEDVIAGLVVFLVALPLCLGIALASNAPLFSGVLAGILGGIIVGAVSRSHTSVSGTSASLTAIIAAQIASLGSFEAFLLALVVAGLMQIVLGVLKGGFIADFIPTCVIHGLMAAIGVILILKQIPHLLGHDTDPEGEMSFRQPDHETTFSELLDLVGGMHQGAMVIGLICLAVLLIWDRIPRLKSSLIPAPLVVVSIGIGLNLLFRNWGTGWMVGNSHLVQMPILENAGDFFTLLKHPDFSVWQNPAIYTAGMTIALVASLETLLNLEAVDKIDPLKRTSPPSRELIAQGVGNLTCGLIGGLPISSVIIRSSININAGGRTKRATIFHGVLLLLSAVCFPVLMNLIPLASLAAILIVTGIKLAPLQLFQRMWRQGLSQFLPFVCTLTAIVLTDLLVGILIGLGISIFFILDSYVRRPLLSRVEKRLGGQVIRITLPNLVSFLHRAALMKTLEEIPRGSHVLIDASLTYDIDPDVLELIHEFDRDIGPARNINVNLTGFDAKSALVDRVTFSDSPTQDFQRAATPQQVLQILQDGHERFRSGERLLRDLKREVGETAAGQYPLAVVLSCIDSRTPAELIFDLGVGDIFNIRMAGNVISNKVLGSMEYGCAVAGAKLILVMGHTRCGAVTSAVDLFHQHKTALEATGCEHLDTITQEIITSIDPSDPRSNSPIPAVREACLNEVVRRNVQSVVRSLTERTPTLRQLVESGRILIVGGVYDVHSGVMTFLEQHGEPTFAGDTLTSTVVE
ncbi:sulfate transporter [bacterium]|nr:sulfate transporter [bacterium]